MEEIMRAFDTVIAGSYIFRLKIERYMDVANLNIFMNEIGRLYTSRNRSKAVRPVLHFRLDYSHKRNFVDVYVSIPDGTNTFELGKLELYYNLETKKLIPPVVLGIESLAPQ